MLLEVKHRIKLIRHWVDKREKERKLGKIPLWSDIVHHQHPVLFATENL